MEFPPPSWSLRWHEAYHRDERWISATLLSARIAVIVGICAVVIGTMAAFALLRTGQGNPLVELLVIGPVVVPSIALVVAMYPVFRKLGLSGTTLGFVIAHTVIALPYAVFMTLAALRNVDTLLVRATLFAAAMILIDEPPGARRWAAWSWIGHIGVSQSGTNRLSLERREVPPAPDDHGGAAPPMTEQISPAQARRIALAAQGFGLARPERVDQGHLRRIVERLGLHQIDSVNVLTRAHYLPAFSRLGAYDPALLDRAAWARRSERRLFEYWAHEASLLPLAAHPLLRWRMARADRGEAGYAGMRVVARERRAEAMAVLERIRQEGPLAASDFESSRAGWWEWSASKHMLEWLFYAGHITTATRRRSFERVYDLTERVIPSAILALPTPPEAEAHRLLIERSARALGIATAGELRDYFRLGPLEAKAAIAALAEEGILVPAVVPGWPPAFLHRDARRPRRIAAQALLAPFDPLVWERARAERLFGFRYRIEIYVPVEKRQHGYYVLPFLLGDRLAARVDLKADRKASRLLVHAVHLEPEAPPETRDALGAELEALAAWLGLSEVAA